MKTTDIDTLKQKVYNGLENKFSIIDYKLLNRITGELNAIEKLNMAEYFIVYSEIIGICNLKGYLRSPGRGSSAGSLVNYCLDITKINPITNNLLFERFINTKITQKVNIEIDVPKGKRKELISLLSQKNHEFNVYQLIYPKTKENNYEKIRYENEEFFVHPCATIITKSNLNEKHNVIRIKGFNYIVFCENSAQEKSLINNRYNILELEYLNKIQDTCNLIGDTKLQPYSLPLDDSKTFEKLVNEGCENIFQFNTEGMNRLLIKFEPTNNLDLAIINATFRPLALENLYKVIDNKKNGYNQFRFKTSEINKLLNKTYGVLIYQEDIDILICQMARLEMNTADYYRRILFYNKDKEKIEEFKSLFVSRCKKESSLSKKEISDFTELIVYASRSAFVKSHALSYSTIAYWGLYYRTHFKEQFNKIFDDKNELSNI